MTITSSTSPLAEHAGPPRPLTSDMPLSVLEGLAAPASPAYPRETMQESCNCRTDASEDYCR